MQCNAFTAAMLFASLLLCSACDDTATGTPSIDGAALDAAAIDGPLPADTGPPTDADPIDTGGSTDTGEPTDTDPSTDTGPATDTDPTDTDPSTDADPATDADPTDTDPTDTDPADTDPYTDADPSLDATAAADAEPAPDADPNAYDEGIIDQTLAHPDPDRDAAPLDINDGPEPVDLRTAGDYVILAKAAISTTGLTAIVGNIGVSPADGTAITGFGLSAPPTSFTLSPLVTGQVHAANYDIPTPAILTAAISDMETAYNDAAARPLPDFIELGAGNIDGLDLEPGLYKWGTGVLIPNGVTLTGGANDVWIFQIAGSLQLGNGAIVTLNGGAQPHNIFWQVAGQVRLGTDVDFKGIILSRTLIEMQTGVTMIGRAYAQTAVTLDAAEVTEPEQ